MNILVIGGAGFIGSHIVDALLAKGHIVRVFDNLEPQVHGFAAKMPPRYLNPEVEFYHGDVRNRDTLLKALKKVEAVFYEAAAVGVGQSMYEIRRYVEVNTLGAANFLDILVNERIHLKKIIVASSMSSYGEGKYQCPKHGTVYPKERAVRQLVKRQWEVNCPLNSCGEPLISLATDESKPLSPTSVYAITKRDHEELFLCIGRAYSMSVVALRYFNVYGHRQALSNPYTGVAAIFAARILNGNPPLIFEDGLQSRDFIHVSDIVQANLLALEKESANGNIFNIGTGKPITILEIARQLSQCMQFEKPPEIKRQYRMGDIRHCYADIGKARKLLGYNPKVSFPEGVKELASWVAYQIAEDKVKESTSQLLQHHLIH